MTVGELRAALGGLPDDAQVLRSEECFTIPVERAAAARVAYLPRYKGGCEHSWVVVAEPHGKPALLIN